jgi:hypothetical protein
MCSSLDDDVIDELALGRARGTEEEAHLHRDAANVRGVFRLAGIGSPC